MLNKVFKSNYHPVNDSTEERFESDKILNTALANSLNDSTVNFWSVWQYQDPDGEFVQHNDIVCMQYEHHYTIYLHDELCH